MVATTLLSVNHCSIPSGLWKCALGKIDSINQLFSLGEKFSPSIPPSKRIIISSSTAANHAKNEREKANQLVPISFCFLPSAER